MDTVDVVVDVLAEVLGRPASPVQLHEPEFRGKELEYLSECISTGYVSSVGQFVDRFESHVAQATGTKFAVAVANGTAALQIALLVAGVRPQDEVIVPTLSFVATANAVVHAGAVPHFVDVSELTLGMDWRKLQSHLEKAAILRTGAGAVNRETGRRISAVVPMHTFGCPVDIGPLLSVCDEWGISIVEDAAEALGSSYSGLPCGGFGRVSALSFNGNKIITTGGGGAVVTNEEDIARRAKHITTTAKLPHEWEFYHDEVGFNYRMPSLNAALGCAQFEQLENRLQEKRALAKKYIDAFANIEGVTIFEEPEGSKSNYWLNTLLLDDQLSSRRNEILTRLRALNIIARPAWTLNHKLPMYSDNPRSTLDISEKLSASIISIPSSAFLGRAK